ncbi:MAG: maleylpyruvate isomerase family mycothiol-dependent enzyme [Kineosporiaceae bacterium]
MTASAEARPRPGAVARVADVEAERLSLALLLDGLDHDAWRTPSLCAGWTVKDVAAHLALADHEFVRTLLRVARARGDFDAVTADMARELAARSSPADLVARIRSTAGSPRRFPFSGALDPLTDVLVHGQDIARPLGLARPIAVDLAVAALENVRTSAFYGARRRLAGMRMLAVDADWSAGDGPDVVRRPAADLLLLLTGREIP